MNTSPVEPGRAWFEAQSWSGELLFPKHDLSFRAKRFIARKARSIDKPDGHLVMKASEAKPPCARMAL